MKVVLWVIPVVTLLTYTVEGIDDVPSNNEAYFTSSTSASRGLAKGKKGDKSRRSKKGASKKSNKSSKSKKKDDDDDDNGLPAALVKKKEDGMVTTSHPLATQAGLKILKKGGTAADAMVAVQTVLGLVEPQSSGLGGGSFAVYYAAATKQVTTFDGREKAPAAATGDRFAAATSGFVQAWQSGLSVGVPGTPKLLERVHARYGHLEWASLFEPAIQLAETGFPLDGATSAFVQRLLSFNGDCQDGSRFMFRDPVAFEYFVNSTDCTAKPAGTILTNEEYAATLRAIADSGAASFYTGTIAEDIAAAVTNDIAIPGDMTTDDLQNYEVVERDPVCVDYKDDYKVCGMGPPSSGALAVGQIIGILANFDVHSDDPLDVDNVHLFTQAMRLAFADRALYVADPDFVAVPVEGMLDHDYLTNRAQLIDLDQDTVATPGVPPGDFDPLGPDDTAKTTGTSHFSIVDRYGNAISMTTSIESAFGNGVMVHGFLLNNELTDFSFAPTTEDGQPIANRVEGNKRPRSSMAPTIVLRRGKAKLLTGSPGGTRIIGYTAKSVWNILEFGYDAQETINVPHYQNRNAGTELEDSIPGLTLDYNATALAEHLTMMGHDVTIEGAGVLRSGLGIIQIDGRKLIGGADQRRDGAVA